MCLDALVHWRVSRVNSFFCVLLNLFLVLSQCLMLYGGLRYQRRLGSLLGRFTWLWGRFGRFSRKMTSLVGSFCLFFVGRWRKTWIISFGIGFSCVHQRDIRDMIGEFLLYLLFVGRVVFYDLLGCALCYEICGVR